MKNILITGGTICIALLATLGCNPKSANGDLEENIRAIGTWNYVLAPVSPFLKDSTTLQLSIDGDKAFEIIVLQRSEKTLYSSTGTWSASVDSISLIGDECMALDTAGDTLAQLDPQDCSQPIVIALPKEADSWTIKTATFTAALSSLPIQPEALSMVLSVIQSITLSRKE